MKLSNFLNIWNGDICLSDGKHRLEYNSIYNDCSIISISPYKYNIVRVIIKTK